ncbi:uncharacterized protein LOC6734746 [Drosophila simulans]|uniref:GD11180 n=1 Tax=Drosophila simulans TaxID=7240 RepID=B4QHW3_DROSI|nr:uncharacterized protein LOC6734746 [Drosophila simulans]EDX07334.1 GD11180 [Drosophila simulans]KMY94230.1 uncharacterized protein Dsimw501_GD11180 [Drosophila simulans]
MDSPVKQRRKPKNLDQSKLDEDPGTQKVEFKKDIIDEVADQAAEYDYMKYPSNKEKAKLLKCVKPLKSVTFKAVVELVTFSENWKMKMSESRLRSEDEQLKNSQKYRNY